MKLNKQQIQALANSLQKSLNDKIKEKNKANLETQMKSPQFKKDLKELEQTYTKLVSILEKFDNLPYHLDNMSSDFSDLKNIRPAGFECENLISQTEIEREIILASIDSKDLTELTDRISKRYEAVK
jgi:hypothetical protein